MSLRTEVDLSRFTPVLNKALTNTSRELSVAINARMYFLLSKSLNLTKRAKEQAIRKLGLYKFDYFTRKGTLAKRGKSVQDVSASTMSFIRIHQKRHGGRFIRDNFTNRKEIEEAAYAWISRKIKAIGFLASLWIKPLRRFDRFAANKAAISGDARRNSGKHNEVTGIARPAAPGFNPIAEAGFVVGVDKEGQPLRAYAQTLLTTAFQRGINAETAEMKRHLEDKVKKACRAAGMEVRG